MAKKQTEYVRPERIRFLQGLKGRKLITKEEYERYTVKK